MAKTKKMAVGGMGGAAKAAMQSVKSAPRTYAAPAGTPKANMGGATAGVRPPSGGPMGGIMSAVKQAAQAIPKSSAPPPGAPRGTVSAGNPTPADIATMQARFGPSKIASGAPRVAPPPPSGRDTGQKIDYAAQNAAGPGKLGNYGPPPNLPPQMQGIGQAMRGQQANMPPPQEQPTGRPTPVQGVAPRPSSPPPQGGMGGMQAKFGPPSVAPGAPKTMGGMGMKKGGTVSSRADGIAQRGKTRGKIC